MPNSGSSSRREVHAFERRDVAWAAVAAALLFASTFDGTLLRGHVAVRAALLAAALVPAGRVLMHLLPLGRVDESSRRRFLIAVFSIHVLATMYFLPLSVLFDRRPIVTADHGVHYAQCVRARHVFWHRWRVDCYSPFFMAGYPAGTVFDVDMKGAELFCTFLPIPIAGALKLFILGAYLTMVATLFRGSRLLGFGVEESAFGLLMFLAYWHWGRPYAGDFRYVGMFSFVLASHLCLLLAGLLREFLRGTHRRLFFVLGPLTFLVHVAAVVLIVAPFAAILLCDRARIRRRDLELLFLWAFGVLFVNVLWLKPVIEFLPEKTPTNVYYQVHGMAHLLRLLVKPTGAVAVSFILLGALGAGRLVRHGRGSIAAPCAAASLFLLLCAAYGVNVPGLDQMEPGRFLFSAIVFLTPLAGSGAAWVLDAALRPFAAAGHARWRAAAIAALALVSLPLALVESKTYYRHTVTVALEPDVEALRGAIVERVHPGARLMIEDASATAYGGVYLPALLPGVTGVEQIGGPYPHTPLRHYATSFTSSTLLGTALADWRPGDLLGRLRFLRVRWIATATPPAARTIAALPEVRRVWSRGPYSIFELPEGGRPEPAVDGGYDRLHLSFAEPRGTVVIPYHWVRGLHTRPPAEIFPVLRYDDAVPYIGVRPHGLNDLVVEY